VESSNPPSNNLVAFENLNSQAKPVAALGVKGGGFFYDLVLGSS
jgi:hypothetical protein